MSRNILYTTDAGGYREATLDEIMTNARHALGRRVRKGTLMDSPKATVNYLMARLATREFETFTLIYLDNRHRLIACDDLFRGTIDGASVRPREVVTHRLREALAFVDSRVLDHVIIAGAESISFAQMGLLRAPERSESASFSR